MLTSPTRLAPNRHPDKCKCGHAMLMHGAKCAVPGCKCKQFRFPAK